MAVVSPSGVSERQDSTTLQGVAIDEAVLQEVARIAMELRNVKVGSAGFAVGDITLFSHDTGIRAHVTTAKNAITAETDLLKERMPDISGIRDYFIETRGR